MTDKDSKKRKPKRAEIINGWGDEDVCAHSKAEIREQKRKALLVKKKNHKQAQETKHKAKRVWRDFIRGKKDIEGEKIEDDLLGLEGEIADGTHKIAGKKWRTLGRIRAAGWPALGDDPVADEAALEAFRDMSKKSPWLAPEPIIDQLVNDASTLGDTNPDTDPTALSDIRAASLARRARIEEAIANGELAPQRHGPAIAAERIAAGKVPRFDPSGHRGARKAEALARSRTGGSDSDEPSPKGPRDRGRPATRQ